MAGRIAAGISAVPVAPVRAPAIHRLPELVLTDLRAAYEVIHSTDRVPVPAGMI